LFKEHLLTYDTQDILQVIKYITQQTLRMCLQHLEREADIESSWDTLEVMASLIPFSNHATGETQTALLGLDGMAQLAVHFQMV
jgi:hypothetical protein